MAVVRISQRLIEETLYKVRHGFELRRRPLTAAYSEAVSQATPLLQAAFPDWMYGKMGVTRAQLDAVGKFTNKTGVVSVTSVNGLTLRGTMYLRWDPPIHFAPGQTSSSLNDPDFASAADILRPAIKSMEALDNEERAFSQQVKNLLRECTTLRQALDIWPDLLTVLPQEYIDRHNEKVEKRERVIPNVAIDKDALMSSVIRNKLATAGGMGTP